MRPAGPVRNWSGTVSCQPRGIYYVDSVDAVCAALSDASKHNTSVRAIGSRHSKNDIAMSDGYLLILRGLNRVRRIDLHNNEVVAEAGITLSALAQELAGYGLALPCLSSTARQTLAGAVATGTHSTGVAFGTLSTWIKELEMVTADGTVVIANRQKNPDLFHAGRVSLGALGVHTAFRLAVVRDFDMLVEEGPVSLEAALEKNWWSSADHARIWYLPHVKQAWGWRAYRIPTGSYPKRGSRTTGSWLRERAVGYHFFQAGLRLATRYPALLPSINYMYTRALLGRSIKSAGPNIQKFMFDCLFPQHVSEWAVPIEKTRDAVLNIREFVERGKFRVHLPIDVRFTAGDDIWLSPAQGGPRCWIGTLAYIPWGREPDWRSWFTAFEEQARNMGGRPHWAKYFSVPPGLFRKMYHHWEDFLRVRRRLDPLRRFSNPFVERVLGV